MIFVINWIFLNYKKIYIYEMIDKIKELDT